MSSHIRSMTGFGKASLECGAVAYEVEAKSLNHRFLDISIRLPRSLSALEMTLRSLVGGIIKRGRVEVVINRKSIDLKQTAQPTLNRGLFDSYLKIYRDLMSEFGSGFHPEHIEKFLPDILSRPGVLSDEQAEQEVLSPSEQQSILSVVERAVRALDQSREVEGKALAKEVNDRFKEFSALIEKLKSLASPSAIDAKERLEERLKKLFPTITVEEGRLVQEAGLLAERLDVQEEMQRLTQHLTAFQEALKEQSPGKRIDFLLQEMNRECNTVASKSQNAPMSHVVVEAKVTLEKIREQIQNME